MKNKRKISIAVIIGICFIILIGLFYKSYVHYFYHERETEIYKLESAYRLENEILDPTDGEIIQRYWIEINE